MTNSSPTPGPATPLSAVAPLVLLVEDEPQMRRFLVVTLELHHYRVHEAVTGGHGLLLATEFPPDAVLLDLGLPDIDGLEIVRRLREWSQVPIIVISARGRESDKVAALDLGADDYVTKPFSTGELLARLRVALRHAARTAELASSPVVELGEASHLIRIDLAARSVTRQGEPVHLTPIEFRLLATLAKQLDRVLTHKQLLDEVWGPGHADETHTLRVHMANLRRKVERDPARPQFLMSELGVGYRLRSAASAK